MKASGEPIDQGTVEATPSEATPGRSLFGARLPRLTLSFSGLQASIGLTAGILSIAGALFSIPHFFSPPPPPGKGEIVAIIQDAKTEKAVSDAVVEILTPQNAVVTTVTPNYFGKARSALPEGQYRVRVSHPRFGAEVRTVQVAPGHTAEVQVRLRSGTSSALHQAARIVDEGVVAVRRLFGK